MRGEELKRKATQLSRGLLERTLAGTITPEESSLVVAGINDVYRELDPWHFHEVLS